MKPLTGEQEEKMADEVREILAKFPGFQFEVLTFLGDRISETLTGETAPVVVSIFGEDLDLLDQQAGEIAAVLSTVPGHADVQVKSPPVAPSHPALPQRHRLQQPRPSNAKARSHPSPAYKHSEPEPATA